MKKEEYKRDYRETKETHTTPKKKRKKETELQESQLTADYVKNATRY